MKPSAVIFEAEGSNDKGPDGHRADSAPILKALARRGFDGEICFYRPGEDATLRERFAGRATVALSRVNPGNLPDTDGYWQFLRALADAGTLVQTHPNVMSTLSFKDLFAKLRGTPYAPETTDFYRSTSEMRQRLPLSLLRGPRVLKKNFTATGIGVWKLDRQRDGTIHCTEASDNGVRVFADPAALFKFLEPVFREQLSARPRYFRDRQGLLDVPFLPGIRDGEVRVFLIHDQPVHILHKQPQDDNFSATLFSGARYTADDRLKRWDKVIQYTLWGLQALKPHLKGRSFPIIWSVDSIPTVRANGQQAYVFSDINAAAVGFTSPEIVDRISGQIADAICRELAAEGH